MPLKEKKSCQWPWGGIVIREVFPRREHIECRYDRVRDLQPHQSPRHRPVRRTGRWGITRRTSPYGKVQ